jgi:hypothetical protein
MSAGDVKFIGWTGTTPRYQELPASISYEPITESVPGEIPERVNFVWKKITRRLICHDRDKQAVLQGLQFVDDALTTVSIDANGASQTVNLGGGWGLYVIADSPYATGMSVITASYRKKAATAFDFGLPTGLTIECAGNATQIKYLSHVLESIDAGTGACGALGYKIEILWPVSGVISIADPQAVNDNPIARFDLTCGDVVVDSYNLLGKDYTPRHTYDGTAVDVTFREYEEFNWGPLGIEAGEAWITDRRISDAQKAANVASVLANYPDTEYITYRAEYVERASLYTRKALAQINLGRPAWYAIANFWGYVALRGSWNIPKFWEFNAGKNLDVRWTKSGNIIRLMWGTTVIRQYDVTGLT